MPTRPALRNIVSIAALSQVLATFALAQDSQWLDDRFKDRAATQRVAKKNDAYRPADTGPGLGTLNGQDAPAYSPPPTYVPPYSANQSGPPPMAVGRGDDVYRPSASAPGGWSNPDDAPRGPAYGQTQGYGGSGGYPNPPPAYNPPYAPPPGYDRAPPPAGGYGGGYANNNSGFGQPYTPPGDDYDDRGRPPYAGNRPYMSGEGRPPYREEQRDGTFSANEIKVAGHQFFGSISQGLASVIEYAFQRQGRPNGYILGEDAGGAFMAGLRYGEGTLYTKDAGTHKVYWQGPSLGYDVGAEGSKVMVLVYNLRDPGEIYERFGGVAGSAYVIGGVGINFQTRDHIVLAPIRAGVGLRLGANVGYLKYTPRPTWNPF